MFLCNEQKKGKKYVTRRKNDPIPQHECVQSLVEKHPLHLCELQHLCKLGSTELCLGIARLMQEHKIKEERLDGNVYYSICC